MTLKAKEGKCQVQEEPGTLPYDEASLISQWTYHWVEPVLTSCRRGLLTINNLYRAPRWLSSKHDATAFLEFWTLKERSPSCIGWVWLTLAMGGWTLWWSGLLNLFSDLLQQGTTQSKRTFVDSFSKPELAVNQRLWYGAIVLITMLVRKLVLNKSSELLCTVGYMIRTGMMGAAYQRLLGAKRSWSVGASFNKLAIDCNRIATLIGFGNLIWSNPLRVTLGLTTAYKMMGRCAIPGIAFILVVLCSLFWFASKMRQVRRKLAKLSDERLELTSQAIRSIRTLKSLALEEYYYQRIDVIRERELVGIAHLNSLFAVAASINFWSPVAAASISVAMAVLYDEELEAGKVFGAARAFQALMIPLWMMPTMANRIMASAVASDRIDQILKEPQAEETLLVAADGPIDDSDCPELVLENVTFVTDDGRPPLRKVTMRVERGTVVGVAGSTASGKSTLLCGLAGLLCIESGSFSGHHRVGLCLSPAWVHSGTVADNITFGVPMDLEWLQQVMEATCLEGELRPDQEVGEAGVLLSGGQRQRIALARALYAKPHLLLVDDILTSIDSVVVETIWERCFGPITSLLPSSIKFIVSNNPQVLQRCGQVFHVKDQQTLPGPLELDDGEVGNSKSKSDSNLKSESHSFAETWPTPGSLEGRESPKSWRSLFLLASQAVGGVLVVALLFVVILGIDLSRLARDCLLGSRMDGGSRADQKIRFLLYLSAFGILQGVFTMASNLFTVNLCLRASRQIHRVTVGKILLAKMSALGKISSGHLLNRLGKDLETLDYHLHERLISLLGSGSSLICAILSVALYAPKFLPSLILPALGIIFLQNRFATAWRTLLRLTSQTLAPISTMLSQNALGLPTVRAHRQVRTFINKFQDLLDVYSVSSVLTMTVRRWVSLRCEVMATLYVGGLIVYCVLGNVPGKVVGLLLLHALGAAESIDYIVKHIGEVDYSLIAIERTAVYASRLPLEGEHALEPAKLEGELRLIKPPSAMQDVPREETVCGDIVFKDITIKFDDHALLSGLNLKIGQGERVAIIGRTGVGKSSLISILLGLCDYDGMITIDGRDAKTLPLKTLRQSVTSVLQESSLLDIPIRESLDPLNKYRDGHIWSILEELNLASVIRGLEFKLDDWPTSLSVGQRQLICIARALLRCPRILFLDEATSALDLQDDITVHRKIFALLPTDATIVTITHRPETAQLYQRTVQLKSFRAA